jgi:PAS domain S-box-containing protein
MTEPQLEELSKEELISRILAERNYHQQRNEDLLNVIQDINWDGRVGDKRQMPHPDDMYHALFEAVSGLKDKAGEVVRELTDLTNNLEMKIAEKIIDRIDRESNLRAVLDNLNAAVFMVDTKYRLVEFNEVFTKEVCSRHHFEPQPGQVFLDMIDDHHESDQWQERIDKTLEGKQGIYIDQSLQGDDTHVYEIKTYPIIESGKVRGVIIFISDITHIQKSELKLIEKNRDLDRINKELDNFVYRISHDLRAPLTSIMGLINLIKLEQDQDKLSSYIDLQEKSVMKLDHFIKDIINLSRNTRIAVSVEEIHYNELLTDIFARFDQHPTGSKIEKRVFIDGHVPFYSDKQRLEVMLTSLVSNGIKFYDSHQSNPYVHVYITAGPEESIIEVRDNGIGIAAEYLNKIYSMFFRAAKDNPGSGLGLYIVKEIINKVKGQISVRSKLREGTTFTVRIPNLVKRYEAAPKVY